MNYEQFENDIAVRAALKLATDEWGVTDPAPKESHRMQMALVLAFGHTDPLDETHALGIIAKMGDTFEAAGGEEATVGLGEVLVGAARLAANHELAIAPILDLARLFTQRADVVPLNAQARLARAAHEYSLVVDDTARRARLVGALAMCVAKGLEDVELIHEVRVKPDELLVAYGREVLDQLESRSEDG